MGTHTISNFTDWSIELQSSQISRITMSQKLNSFPAAPESKLFVRAPRCLSEKWNMEENFQFFCLSLRKMKTFSLVPAHSRLRRYFGRKSPAYGSTHFQLFISLQAEMHLPSVQQDLLQETLAFILTPAIH